MLHISAVAPRAFYFLFAQSIAQARRWDDNHNTGQCVTKLFHP